MSEQMNPFQKLKPLFDTAEKVLLSVCKLLLIGDIIITTISVAGRYLPFLDDPTWSEELVLTQMVCMAVLSATIAIRRGAHIRMTAFDKAMSEMTILALDLISDIAIFLLGILLLVYGAKLCASPVSTLGRYVSLPFLSKFWEYISVPVAGFGMAMFELEQIANRCVTIRSKMKGGN